VVFIDVEDGRRLGRSLVTVEQLQHNDQMKRERGVERIAREADVVVDNNGTIEASMVALLHHAHVRGGTRQIEMRKTGTDSELA